MKEDENNTGGYEYILENQCCERLYIDKDNNELLQLQSAEIVNLKGKIGIQDAQDQDQAD